MLVVVDVGGDEEETEDCLSNTGGASKPLQLDPDSESKDSK
jgi:hypothetical protein